MIHPFPFFRSFAFVRQNYKPTVSAASWYPNSHNYTIDFVSHNAGCWVYFKWPHFKWNRSCFFSSLSASCIIYTSWINFIWKTENCGCCIITMLFVRYIVRFSCVQLMFLVYFSALSFTKFSLYAVIVLLQECFRCILWQNVNFHRK